MDSNSILAARYQAGEIYDSLQVAYWVRGDGNTEYHTNFAHLSFAKLAAAMGYTIAPIVEPVEKDAAE